MRTLEVALLISLTLRLMAGIQYAKRWIKWSSIGTLAILALHLSLEGYRWQMIPTYGAVMVLAGLAVIRLALGWDKKQVPGGKPILQAVTRLLVLVGLVSLPLLLPVPKIRKPTGPYPVGTFSVMLTDTSREERYSPVPGGSRRLMVQFWYPADPQPGSDPGPWVENPDVIAPAVSEFLGFPAFFLDHLKYAQGGAFPDAPIVNNGKRFPVLVFSHGWTGFRAQNTYQMVALASHGYVVAAPDHTYGAVATVFPDGEIALVNRNALPSGMGLPEEAFMEAAQLLGAQWTEDLRFILESLTAVHPLGRLGIFDEKLDFNKVGALGHSTGGGATIQFCALDSRCKAVLAMDPYMDPIHPDVLAQGAKAPVMAMFSDGQSFSRGDNLNQFETLEMNSTGAVYKFEIKGSAHYDFSDLPAFSPLAHTLGLKGPIRGDRALEIITDYTLAFFGRYLMDEDGGIVEGEENPFPEVLWW